MGEVVQLRDYQSKRDLAVITEAISAAIAGEPTMIGMEPIVYLDIDTAPSEMNPFHGDTIGACGPCESATLRGSDLPPYSAPDKDSA